MKEKILYLFPRVLAILSISFMMLFSLDSFEGDRSFFYKLGAFAGHNIPVFILILVLLIAWRKELIGGLLFVAASVTGFLFFHSFTGNPGSIVVITPFLLTGVLFILHYLLSRKKEQVI